MAGFLSGVAAGAVAHIPQTNTTPIRPTAARVILRFEECDMEILSVNLSGITSVPATLAEHKPRLYPRWPDFQTLHEQAPLDSAFTLARFAFGE